MGGHRRGQAKGHVFVFNLPPSGALYVRAYPTATGEAWIDGHVQEFSFFGSAPLSILYDKDRCLVSRIERDGTRWRPRLFSGFLSHYLIRDRYGHPGKRNDKGGGGGPGGLVAKQLHGHTAPTAWTRKMQRVAASNEPEGNTRASARTDTDRSTFQDEAAVRARCSASPNASHASRALPGTDLTRPPPTARNTRQTNATQSSSRQRSVGPRLARIESTRSGSTEHGARHTPHPRAYGMGKSRRRVVHNLGRNNLALPPRKLDPYARPSVLDYRRVPYLNRFKLVVHHAPFR